MRQLGIPTVLGRLIQQALHQALRPLFEPDFSEHNYESRPKRSAQQALMAAWECVAQGRRRVVDIDLEKSSDRVSHDVLMTRRSQSRQETGAEANPTPPAGRLNRRRKGRVAGNGRWQLSMAGTNERTVGPRRAGTAQSGPKRL